MDEGSHWHLEEGANSHVFDGRVIDAHGDCVAFVSLGSTDANLVVSAPDLLAQLMMAVSWIEDLGRKNSSHQLQDAYLSAMRAAIAKATQ